ncbi:MAG: VanZ family protein [Hydrogenophaga sp.]|uniref:VanZ family protein n=1 Tax=Polaromonas sp. TaxID=1869339 RepID=UPI002733A938|nr:VanZ family protein [Polaromonas sp.]MDP3167251.1 VanZ family protein [Hydrogenophaga sp.]MDP3797994.1 VanZ family protein [Polaromonas sp.]
MNTRLIRTAFWCSAIVLAIASLVPVDLLPRQAATIWDKGQHAFGFAWLALVGLLAYSRRPWPMLVGLVVYGGVIELLQAATGWRYGEWLDFLADGIGTMIGTALWLGLRRLTTPQS